MPRVASAAAARSGGKKRSSVSKKPEQEPHGKTRSSSKEKAFLNEAIKNRDWSSEGSLDNTMDFNGLVDKYTREVFYLAEDLPAVVLINNGRFDDVSIRDVEELFNLLDADEDGMLDFGEIELLLKEVIQPPCTDEQVRAVFEQADIDAGGFLTAEELLNALKGPVKESLKRMQHENLIKKEFMAHHGFDVDVSRELMLEKFKWSVERDDSFKTLPMSIVHICVFIFLVVSHLAVWERQQCERGIDLWIKGYGEDLLGPYLGSVANVDGMFEWLTASGLPAVFGNCQTDATGNPFCRIGTRSILVGDAQLKETRRDGSLSSTWLLHSPQAREHLRVNPGDYLGAVTAVANIIRQGNRTDQGTVDLRLFFGTYGIRSGLFGQTSVRTSFDDYGRVLPNTVISAAIVSPYPRDVVHKVVVLVIDGLYVFFLLIPTCKELRDLIKLMRMTGVSDGFFGYWGFWNCVDWVSILCGYVNVVVWILCCQAMSAASIQAVLIEGQQRAVLDPGTMNLSEQRLEELHKDLGHIVSLFDWLRISMCCTACSILLKFFKAFQANPRLQVVTDTMGKAAVDIFHFGVVFGACFLGFVITGHIFFGNDLKQFRRLSASIDTCFVVLMGDFEWYAKASEADVGLSSGMPYWILAAWFWMYMVFVLMILLNMLLAIILDHYTEITNQIKLDMDVPALWEQTAAYLRHRKKAKSHIPLAHMAALLNDDDNVCHVGEHVTENSLMEAFPKMQSDQAEHLVTWLKQEAKKQLHEADDEIVARLKMLEKYIEAINQDIHMVKLNTAMCASLLRGPVSGDEPLEGKSDVSISFVVDQLGEHVQRLILRMGGSVRELVGRMDTVGQELGKQSFSMVQMASGPAEEEATPLMRRSLPFCFSPEGCRDGERNVVVGPCERVSSRAAGADTPAPQAPSSIDNVLRT